MWVLRENHVNRLRAFGLSVLLLAAWLGQTAVVESGLVGLLLAGGAVGVTGFGGGVLLGAIEPDPIPDEQLEPLTGGFVGVTLLVGTAALAGSLWIHLA